MPHRHCVTGQIPVFAEFMTDKIDMGYSCDIRITAHCGFPYRFAYVQIFPCISVGYINIIQRNILHIVRFVFIINTAGNCTGHFRIRGSYVRYIHAVNAANLFFIVFKAVAKPNKSGELIPSIFISETDISETLLPSQDSIAVPEYPPVIPHGRKK